MNRQRTGKDAKGAIRTALFISMIFSIFLLPMKHVLADAPSARGEVGEVSWYYNSATNELRIYGSGKTPDYAIIDGDSPPWYPKDSDQIPYEDLMIHSIKKITVEEGVTYIGSNLFNCCSDAAEITLPDSVTGIGPGAFLACVELKSIRIPPKVSILRNSIFAYCDGITKIVIPKGVKKIESGAFRSCYGIKKMVFEKGSMLTTVGEGVFHMFPPYTKGRVFMYYRSDTAAYPAFRALQAEITKMAEDAYPKTCDWKWIGLDDSGNAVTETGAGETIQNPVSIKKASVTGIKNMTWTGKALRPQPVVKINGKTLIKGTDYTLSYKNNINVGEASVIITGKGIYTNKIVKTFRILPKGTTIVSLVPKTKAISVKWNLQKKQTNGYQLQASLDPGFTKGKRSKLIISNAVSSAVIKNLEAGKVYYVRIRTYKNVGAGKYYSAWSKPGRIRTK
ncbi:MAG: leucine-rich repeat protein [Blautia sp.]|nr:leucine-rich repeat protein [Blautia sp.]